MVVLYWSCERTVVSVNTGCSRDARARCTGRSVGTSWEMKAARPLAVFQRRSPALLVSRKPPGTRTRALKSWRSEEHTSELQSLMRSSYAVLCSKKKTQPVIYPCDKISHHELDS